MAIPKVVGGLIWKVLYDPLVGPINYVLESLHLSAPAWLGDPHFALVSVGIVDIWQWIATVPSVLLAVFARRALIEGFRSLAGIY